MPERLVLSFEAICQKRSRRRKSRKVSSRIINQSKTQTHLFSVLDASLGGIDDEATISRTKALSTRDGGQVVREPTLPRVVLQVVHRRRRLFLSLIRGLRRRRVAHRLLLRVVHRSSSEGVERRGLQDEGKERCRRSKSVLWGNSLGVPER